MTTLYLAIALWFGVHWSYVAVMHAKAVRGRLTLYWNVMLLPLAVIGYALDVAFNLTFGFMFLELPHELLFSSRVERHFRNSDGWRLRLATFFARNLNVFDESHVTPPKG